MKTNIFWYYFVLIIGWFFSFCNAGIQITEVFYDGNDEWIELTNTTTSSFSGQLRIMWAKSSSFSVSTTLLPWESKVRWDEWSMFQPTIVSFVSGQWLQFSDTTWWVVELSGQGEYDVFYASKSLVDKRNNFKTSLCKSSLWLVSACESENTRYVVSWFVANPWWVNIWEWWSSPTISVPPIETWSNDTGYDQTTIDYDDTPNNDVDLSVTWDEPLTNLIESEVDLCPNTWVNSVEYYPSPLFISEVYPFGDNSGSYIEIYAHRSFSWTVGVSGAGAGESTKFVHFSIETGQYIILSSTGSWWDILIIGLSLRDEGESLSLIGQSWQVFDKVLYLPWKKGRSLYFSSYSWEYNVFWNIALPSPGTGNNYIDKLSSWEEWIRGCSIDQQRTTSYLFWTSLNFKAIIYNGGGDELPLAWYSCVWEYGDGQQTTASCNPSWFNYTSPWLYTVSLRILQGSTTVCFTKSIVNYPELISSSVSSKTSSSSSIPPAKTPSTQTLSWSAAKPLFQEVDSWTNTIPMNIKTLHISGILPNPDWKDADREALLVVWTTGAYVSISWLTLKVATKSYVLESFIFDTTLQHVFTWTFAFNNTKWCVDLLYQKNLLDRFCYDGTKENEWLLHTWTTSLLSEVLPNSLSVAVRSSNTKNTPKSTMLTSKSTSSSSKSSTSSKTTSKTTTKKTSSPSSKTQDAKDKKIRQLTKEIVSTERMFELQKNYIDLMSKEIQPYESLFSGNKFQTYERAYRLLSAQAKQSDVLQWEKFTIPVTDIRTYVALAYNILPIEADLSIPYMQIWQNTILKWSYIRSRIAASEHM